MAGSSIKLIADQHAMTVLTVSQEVQKAGAKYCERSQTPLMCVASQSIHAMNFMKQSHGLPELTKRRFFVCIASFVCAALSPGRTRRANSTKSPLNYGSGRFKAPFNLPVPRTSSSKRQGFVHDIYLIRTPMVPLTPESEAGIQLLYPSIWMADGGRKLLAK